MFQEIYLVLLKMFFCKKQLQFTITVKQKQSHSSLTFQIFLVAYTLMHNKLLVGLNFQAYIHLQQRLQIFYLHNIKNGWIL